MGISFIHLVFVGSILSLFMGCGTIQPQGPLSFAAARWIYHPKGAVSYLNKQLNLLAPAIPSPTDKEVFARYRKDGVAQWSTNWTANLDFTGVAWDSPRAGVLVHPRYVLFASHFQRRTGETLVFHDRTGRPHRRRLLKKKTIHRVGTPDVTVGQLDLPVPNSITHYAVLPPGYDYRLLNGAKFVVTDYARRVHLFRINRVQQSGYEQVGGRKGIGTDIHSDWHKHLVPGDSGHPAFLVIQGRLVLLSTLKGGGWASQGPFYGGPTLQNAIVRAIAVMEEPTKPLEQRS